MKFINRTDELEELEKVHNFSKKKLFPILITGQRRVGKTRLVEEFCKSRDFLYFFIYEGKSLNSMLKEFERELKEKKIIDEHRSITTIAEFIEIIFMYCRNYIIIFDEVQYMMSIYKPFFSLMQRNIDKNEDQPAMFIFLGSVIGMIKKVFEELKSPLYGRMKHEILLNPMKYKDIREFLFNLEYNSEQDFISFYGIFGGFPKYYVAMEDYQLKNLPLIDVLEFLFFRQNAPLKNEVINVLRQEFGKGKGYYYEILEAIATGHTKLNEIANCCGKHQTEITSFMSDLMDYYQIIERETPITDNPRKTRKSIYKIKSPLFLFWFRFVYPNLRYMELNRYDVILKKIETELNTYLGLNFEDVCKQIVNEFNETDYTLIGRWWGHKKEGGGRSSIEIDLIALNEENKGNKGNKEILFGECKWKMRVDAEKIIIDLLEKAKHVDWYNSTRNEKYCVFAKSFSKKISEYEDKTVACYDLKDIEKILKLKK